MQQSLHTVITLPLTSSTKKKKKKAKKVSLSSGTYYWAFIDCVCPGHGYNLSCLTLVSQGKFVDLLSPQITGWFFFLMISSSKYFLFLKVPAMVASVFTAKYLYHFASSCAPNFCVVI